MLEDLIKLLHEASDSAINDAMVTRGSKWIEALKREFPGAHAVIMALLYQEPRSVLNVLAGLNKEIAPYTSNKHALAYISALQDRLKGKKANERTRAG